jgi:geranylgeranyl diphosphate synthase type II
MHAMEISKSNFDFNNYANLRRTILEERLREYMQLREPSMLWESMGYSVLSGGKRLRALLCMAAAEGCVEEDQREEALQAVLPCACAIEMIHAMSLIHDDLPALDNDDLRRGKPTNHKVFGEALALLAGDALLMLAIEVIVENTPARVTRDNVLKVALELSRATGASGMVGGQVDDLKYTGQIETSSNQIKTNSAGEGGAQTNSEKIERPASLASSASSDQPSDQPSDRPEDEAEDRFANRSLSGENSADELYIDESVLASIHKRKTGALIRFAAWSGAKLVDGTEAQVATISEYAEILGLAFQIADDVLDITGDAHTLGKTPGKDEASKKATWVRVFGKEESERRLYDLERRGLELLQNGCIKQTSAEVLGALLSYAVHRKY